MSVLQDIKEKVIKDKIEEVGSKGIIEDKYLIKNRLIVNSQRGNLLAELKESLRVFILVLPLLILVGFNFFWILLGI